MGNITIKDISVIVGALATFITSMGVIMKFIQKRFINAVQNELVPIKSELSDIKENQKEIDINATKNYLSKCFNDLKQGQELSESCKQRIYEQMEHYEEMGGNSYIHQEFENLKKDGKL